MQPISYTRHQFPAEIIRHATWLYLRFTLSYRDVEELLAERGVETSYETVRRWVLKFGPSFVRNLRRLRPRPTDAWHLDEMVISIQGQRMYLWRALSREAGSGPQHVQPSALSRLPPHASDLQGRGGANVAARDRGSLIGPASGPL